MSFLRPGARKRALRVQSPAPVAGETATPAPAQLEAPETLEGVTVRLADGRLVVLPPEAPLDAPMMLRQFVEYERNAAVLSAPGTREVVWLLVGLILGGLFVGISFFMGG